MKYNCLIVDDNEIERDLLESYVLKLNTFKLIGSCENALQAMEVLNNHKIDVVFSDIDMPDISGLELIKNLKNPPVFVFVTSYPEYALDSINVDALDFIVKPVKLERLVKASNKIIEYLDLKKQSQRNEYTNQNNDFLFIKDGKGYIRINYDEILFIESFGDFSRLYTLDQKQYIPLVNLKNIAPQLPATNFIRVHRQFIVNQNFITSINGNDITLNHQHHIPIGLAHQEKLMELINQKTLTRQNKP